MPYFPCCDAQSCSCLLLRLTFASLPRSLPIALGPSQEQEHDGRYAVAPCCRTSTQGDPSSLPRSLTPRSGSPVRCPVLGWLRAVNKAVRTPPLPACLRSQPVTTAQTDTRCFVFRHVLAASARQPARPGGLSTACVCRWDPERLLASLTPHGA